MIFVLEFLLDEPKMAGCCCVLSFECLRLGRGRREGVILVLRFREDA